MAISPGSLVVKKSTIPGSGNGLFTKKFIPAGTRIIEYQGKVTSWKDADHEDGDNAYIYFVKRTHVIDARKNKKWLARYANDAKGLTRVKGITNNCEYVEDASHVYIHAKKDIPAGGEILVPYGPEYWQVIRYNIRLAAKEKLAASKTKKAGKGGSNTSGKKVTRKSVPTAAEKAAGKSAKRSVDKTAERTTKKSTNKSGSKSANKSVGKSPNKSVSKSANKSVSNSTSKSVSKSASKSSYKTAINSSDKASGKTTKSTLSKSSPSLVQSFPLPPAKTHRTVRTREKQS